MSNKRCCHCCVEKDASQFTRTRKSRDGLHWRCRPCKNSYDQARWLATRPNRIAASSAWLKANPQRARAARNKCDAKDRAKLGDTYVRRILALSGVPHDFVTPALLDAQRAYTAVNRQLRKSK